jgi:phage terminase Nu1 subunit (DNA packaging protein)
MADVDGGRGGRRAGAGRPKGSTSAAADVRARYAEARAAKEEALAALRGMEARIRSGELVEASTVRPAFQRAGRAFRDSMLSIPGRVAAALAVETDERRIEQLLRREMRAELTRLADQVPKA